MDTSTRRVDSLNGTFKGIIMERYGVKVVQYRGLKYASLHERFGLPDRIDSWGGAFVDNTANGSICPQVDLEVERHFYNIPEEQEVPSPDDRTQDEFDCLNMILSMPEGHWENEKLPVMIYIHGGSFVQGNIYRRCEDMTSLVAQSAIIGKPMIAISFGYRLNLFGFSTVNGQGNHGLLDQRCLISWVRKHIPGFSGDPFAITLAGDSAGAVSVHAHILTLPPGEVRRAMIFSGVLGTIPPRTVERQDSMMRRICLSLDIEWGKQGWVEKLQQTSVKDILDAYYSLGVGSLYLTLDTLFPMPNFDENEPPPHYDSILLGDNAFDSYIFHALISLYDQETIVKSVKCMLTTENAASLLHAYNIRIDGEVEQMQWHALNLVHDALFHIPIRTLAISWAHRGKKVYQYINDEANPFMPNIPSQHDGNLLFTFGGYDLSSSPEAEATRKTFQEKLIMYVHGEEPWTLGKIFGFGPNGKSGELSDTEYAGRRRVFQMKALEALDDDDRLGVALAIIAGRTTALRQAEIYSSSADKAKL